MLIARTPVKDSKTGAMLECRRLRLFDGPPQGRIVDLTGPAAYQFDLIDKAMRSFGHIFDINGPRNAWDSTDPLAWNISQLAYTQANMLQRFRAPVIYKDLIDISFEAPPWADSVQTEEFDNLGIAALAAANSTDMPLANAKFGRRMIEVKGAKIGYSYNVQELLESQQLKRPLSDLRMKAAMLAYERYMQKIAFRGETAAGIYGFWNQPSSKITPVQATTGSWDSASTSPLSIIKDINTAITAIYQNSGTNAFCTDIAMPMEALDALNSTILSATSSGVIVPTPISLLAYIKQNNMSKLLGNIDIRFHGIPVDRTEAGAEDTTAGSSLKYAGTLAHDGTASTSRSSRVVYWSKNPEYLVMHQPLTLQFLAPQPRNDEVVVPGRGRFTPIDIRYPSTVYYQDCVLAADDQT